MLERVREIEIERKLERDREKKKGKIILNCVSDFDYYFI